MCRGRRVDGKQCNAPTLAETLEANRQGKRANPIQIAGTVVGLYGAVTGHGLASGALPGQGEAAENAAQEWRQSSQRERRDDQARTMRRLHEIKVFAIEDQGSVSCLGPPVSTLYSDGRPKALQ